MLVLNHSNEENGKRWIVFVYIKQNLSVVFDYNIQQCNFQTAQVSSSKSERPSEHF